jgi:signal transduction histidine kinase
LLIAAGISIAFALALAGLALSALFEKHLRDSLEREQQRELLNLAGSLKIAPDGSLDAGGGSSNPAFAQAYSGTYWWIVGADGTGQKEVARSLSLWDAPLPALNGNLGPEGEALAVTSRPLTIGEAGAERHFMLFAARHESDITIPLQDFRHRLVVYLLPLGLALMAASWLQVQVGLRPLKALRRQVQRLGDGNAMGQRISGDYPQEVSPLVQELNTVLDLRDASLERARKRAGDLAHGLKTPLTVLGLLAARLTAAGLSREGAEIGEQAEAMRRHVDHALARARLSSGHGGTPGELAATLARVIATLRKLPETASLSWEVAVPAEARVPVEQGDLNELLGNLLDNARKWAATRVRIGFDGATLLIEDDGPGVDPSRLDDISARGRRLDESKQGSGLGLSIIADIADIYGLDTAFSRSPLGGLAVAIRFPLRPPA